MTLKLLKHQIQPRSPWRDFGVFDAWADKGLPPTLGDVHRTVIPELKKERDVDGNLLYPFLTKNPDARRRFEHHWLESYQAFLSKDYEEIPDFDPATGQRNKGYLCDGCLNWERLCRTKTDHSKERF